MPVAHGFSSFLSPADALDAVRRGAVLLTAGNRLARTMREQYNAARARAGEQVWESPRIVPWETWLGALHEQRIYRAAGVPVLLTPEQELSLWEHAIRATPESDHLVSVGGTAAAASGTWRLMHAWRIPRREVEIHAAGDTRAFLGWSDAFESHCAAGNWIDSARLPDHLAAALREREVPSRILLAGFDEMTPQQLEFAEACRNAGAAIAVVGSPETTPGLARRVICLDRRHEVVCAARWARSLLEGGEAGIGVVIPDLDKRRREVERAFLDVLHPAAILPGPQPRRRAFSISAGRPLSDYPVIRAAFLALRLGTATAIGPLGALLRSPYIRGAASDRSRRAALDARLRTLGAASFSIAAVLEHANPESRDLRSALTAWLRVWQSLPERQPPGAWAGAFSNLLGALGWPGAPLSSEDYQAVERWSSVLSEYARLDVLGEQVSYHAAVARLERIAAEAVFQPESAPAPIQVLGALEAAGARFERLWITGMDDETWPSPAHPDPFLPAAVQKTFNVPHSSPQRELQYARRRLDALLRAAPSVIVSHAARDRDSELGASPLIRDIPEVSLESLSLPVYPALLDVPAESPVLDRFEDSEGPPLPADRQARGGAKILQYQAECPFRAFTEFRLGAKPLESPEDGLAASERGSLVHQALEHIWTTLHSHADLLAVSPAVLAGIVRDGVAQALAKIETDRGEPLPERFGELERSRVEALLHEWLEIEKQRPPFEVLKVEDRQEIHINGLSASVRIDRIDRLADGRDVVIDYKTGEVKPSDWNGDRPSEPQVPLYALTHDGELGAAALASLKTGKLGFKGISSEPLAFKGAAPTDIAGQKEVWRQVLGKLAADYRAGHAPVDPKKAQTCRYCPLASLCRINESKLGTSALSGEAE